MESLCCHQTSTSWDQFFRKALVSSCSIKNDYYKTYGIQVKFYIIIIILFPFYYFRRMFHLFQGSATGQLFVEMLSDLIKLNNSCENPYVSMEELPLVEQIPILHRLDHSVHTVRMWVSDRCKNLAANWDLDGFYSSCFTDINKCLQILSTLEVPSFSLFPLIRVK